eukprot:CAMPEP_0176374856 /NCGR_PEP_ID=MMETSP0126-20121128/27077_1 /TAXON_ID=141414 ORGANISM="Strombidinopsis acuminatum, Strain SPMC142" /NCGR_SAMPLE_ID=MMETSP0126 /ASSEMBLY_ACC=CAM_ASM_000229 /LENGTH=50 /DNA_ID=CAMNT_0017735653 /DNA_START=1046 /DNA_END=1198 /DNA_ORIENTATION=-
MGSFENNPNKVGWENGLPEVDECLIKETENSMAIVDQKIASCIKDSIYND